MLLLCVCRRSIASACMHCGCRFAGLMHGAQESKPATQTSNLAFSTAGGQRAPPTGHLHSEGDSKAQLVVGVGVRVSFFAFRLRVD